MLAALQAGLRHVILPAANQEDLRDLPESVRDEMAFTAAERIDDVLRMAIPELAHRLAASTA